MSSDVPSVNAASKNGTAAATTKANWTTEEPQFSIESLRNWIVAFVVCDFNVDIGPEVEWVYPPSSFSQTDLSTICFNSFPERSNSDAISDDSTFHFRFRPNSPDIKLSTLSFTLSHDFWYGYCLFRQLKDETVKRNYGQKSFILISQHNFTSLFRDNMLARTLSISDFATSAVMIESACAQIANWQAPVIGRQELPFFGSIFDVHIPPHEAFPLQGLVHRRDSRPNQPMDIYATEPVGSWAQIIELLPSVAELYIIFERVLLAEPVVVLSTNPKVCSEFISLLMDLIRPTPYAGDCRPYVTMHSDFFMQAHTNTTSRHFLIGITNPFILKRLHIPPSKKFGLPSSSSGAKPHIVYLAPNDKKTLDQKDADIPPEVFENDSKAYFSRDWTFIKNLDAEIKSQRLSESELGQIIRRHFAFLTALFLAPLNRYLATLMSISSSTNASEYAMFSESDFLNSLSKHGSSVQFKGKTAFQRNKVADTFYKKFCRCPSFFSWLQMKMETGTSGLDSVPSSSDTGLMPEKQPLNGTGGSNSTSGSLSEDALDRDSTII